MGTGQKLVLLAMAAGLLRAADSPDFIYKLRLPSRAAMVEWTSARVGNWDVAVTVDTAKCELTCAYRLRRGSPAAHLLAPPVVFLRVYSDFVSVPEKLTVDPAGSEYPGAADKFRPSADYPYLPVRKLLVAAPPHAREGLPAASGILPRSFAHRPASMPSLALPLRI